MKFPFVLRSLYDDAIETIAQLDQRLSTARCQYECAVKQIADITARSIQEKDYQDVSIERDLLRQENNRLRGKISSQSKLIKAMFDERSKHDLDGIAND